MPGLEKGSGKIDFQYGYGVCVCVCVCECDICDVRA